MDKIKNKAAVKLGKLGGKARAASMSKERRSEIARKAALTRWKDKPAVIAEGVQDLAQDNENLV